MPTRLASHTAAPVIHFHGGDYIEGDDGDDSISGGDGGDVIFGDVGADFLIGGHGNDHLDTGDDKDRDVVLAVDGEVDTICAEDNDFVAADQADEFACEEDDRLGLPIFDKTKIS